MTSLRSAPLRLLAALMTAGLVASPGAFAAEASQAGTVHTLTPEEKARIEAEAYERAMLGASGLDESGARRIHGEASIMVGTGGARGVGTSIVAPIGKSATLGASFLYERNTQPYDVYGYGPHGHTRGSYGASDRYGHLDRVERMERWQDWRAGRP